MAAQYTAVVIVTSNGVPVVQVTSNGTPATVVTENGIPIQLVTANGTPMVLYDTSGNAYSAGGGSVGLDFSQAGNSQYLPLFAGFL